MPPGLRASWDAGHTEANPRQMATAPATEAGHGCGLRQTVPSAVDAVKSGALLPTRRGRVQLGIPPEDALLIERPPPLRGEVGGDPRPLRYPITEREETRDL